MRKDREEYNAYMREYAKKRYQRRREEAIESLGGKCVDCGAIENLEFDHDDSSTKKFSVSKILTFGSVEKVTRELEKCVLRCNKCHAKKSLRVGDLPPLATHGTFAMYRHHKCRCDACKEANRLMHKSWRDKKRKELLDE